jgi:GNAT superfamily N-acetyltransferase
VLVHVRSHALRRALLDRLTDVLASFPGAYDFRVHVAGDDAELANRVVELLYLGKRPKPLLFISDAHLTDAPTGERGKESYSRATETVGKAFLANGVATSLVSIGDEPIDVPRGIVTHVAPGDRVALRAAIARAAGRVALLSPAHYASDDPRARASGPARFRFRLAENRDELVACFGLRYTVYDVMGNLSPEVLECGLGWEVDFHDGSALQYVAVDVETSAVVGTARLVVPNRPRGTYALADAFGAQGAWFRELTVGVVTPALRKKLLDAGTAALPMLQNARVGHAWRPLMAQAVRGVEMSRVIVDPAYRGFGLARALVRLSLAAALELGRKTVFAECFPGLTPMYRQHGFSEIEGRGTDFDAWGSRPYPLESIRLDFDGKSERPLQAARWDGALFKMANAHFTEEAMAAEPEVARAGGMGRP